MKVIIAGSRFFKDYKLLSEECDKILKDTSDIEIVSGTASGADKNGELYAKNKGYPIKQFFPDWNKFGLAAGPIRNKEMAKYANMLIAFWDGKSKGTKNMIDISTKLNLEIIVVPLTKIKNHHSNSPP